MDPITHTLTGATLAQAGLKRRTALGTAALVIGANVPDVDVAAYFWGPETALWFRRGLTHGVLGVLTLPLVLAGVLMLWDRLVRRRRDQKAEPARFSQLLFLGVLAAATHPLLDWLNVYGIRLLSPFSNHWFYGDALFISDPWVWAILAGGCWAARRARLWPRIALAVAIVYALALGASGAIARRSIVEDLERAGIAPARVMAGPLAVTPFTRWVVVEIADGYEDVGGSYRVGMFRWLREPSLDIVPLPYATAPIGEVLATATAMEPARRFLAWSRFPFYLVRREGEWYRVFISDARYGTDPESGWASTSVRVRADPGQGIGGASPPDSEASAATSDLAAREGAAAAVVRTR